MPEGRGGEWQAPFVFAGRVVKHASATMADVPITATTAVVEVRESYRWPEGVTDYTGAEITLVRQSESPPSDEISVFFARPWIYGEGLALIEVAAQKDDGNARRKVEEADELAARTAMTDRLSRADLVVAGVVRATRPAGDTEPVPTSEHDPLWYEALVVVESIEKGRSGTKELSVMYPSSTDEFWYESPKFHEGDRGVFVLQRNQQERGPKRFRVRGWTALHPLDFQPTERLDVLRSLLKTR
jgi:hypothetical protein